MYENIHGTTRFYHRQLVEIFVVGISSPHLVLTIFMTIIIITGS